MEFEPKDQEIVDLVAKLKNTNGGYPSELLAARRQTYLNQMAGMGLSAGIGTVLKNAAKNGNGTSFAPPSAGTLLEVVLVVAIVAEAGTLAYFNRDKVVEFVRGVSTESNVQEVTSPPVSTFSFPELEISGSPLSFVSTGTASEVPIGTPIPGTTEDLTVNNNEEATPMANSTPIPNLENGNNNNNGNNGNHYGQTPKPERTKENNNHRPPNDEHGNGNNDH